MLKVRVGDNALRAGAAHTVGGRNSVNTELDGRENRVSLESTATRWRFGQVEFDARSAEIVVDGKSTQLERKPRELLRLFLNRPGELLTKADLLEAIWPARVVSESSVTNCISKLRNAIGDPDGDIVRTIHGYGYRFAAAVSIDATSADGEPHAVADRDAEHILPGWVLQQRLVAGVHCEVWTGHRIDSTQIRIVKLARDGIGVDALKREMFVHHYLDERLGHASPTPQLVDVRLDAVPCFLALERADGCDLVSYLASHRADLRLQQRIDRLAQIAEAVAALHSVGVLCAGLSPERFHVVEGPEGPTVMLADLAGSVVATSERSLASFDDRRLGDASIAALYQAPELLGGAPYSLQADVYALGVIVYQTLVGDFRRPMAPGWESQISDPLLREDIAAAAHLDPTQRLTDAAELARRLRALNARSVQRADADQRRLRLEHAERQVQRARARRGPLIALMLVLAIGLAVSVGLARSWQQAVVKEQQAARTTRAVTQFLTEDLLAPANAEPGHAADVTIGTLLDRAAASIDTRFAKDPHTHAALQRVLGMDYAALSEEQKAVPLLLASEAALSKLESPTAEDVLTTRLALQQMLINMPRTSTNLDQIEAVAQRQIDAEAAAGNPRPAYRYMAQVGVALVGCWRTAGTLRGANCAPALDSILADAKKTLGPDDPVIQRLIYNRAALLGIAGRVDRGVVAQFSASLREQEKIHGRGSPKLSLLLLQMSKALEYGGDPAQTIPLLQEAIRDFSATLGKDHPYLWNARRALGVAYVRAGRYREAVELQRQQLQQVTSRYGAESRERLTALRFLAAAEVAAGQLGPAAAHISEGLALNERVIDGTYDAIELRDLLATIDEQQHRSEEALAVLRTNLTDAALMMPGADVPLGRYGLHLARRLLALGQAKEARNVAAQALLHFDRVLDADSELVVAARELQQQAMAKADATRPAIADNQRSPS